MNGTIELSPYEYNMDETWMIESNCENVRIWSEFFETEIYDILWIGTKKYYGCWTWLGSKIKINQTMTNNTTIRFESNGVLNKKGFKLIWNCENKIN